MLRSIKELQGYTLQAKDGEIGRVSACYFNDRTWIVRYMVVETGNWLTQRKVLLAPLALGIPNWKTQKIPVLLNQEQIKNSPRIDVDKPVSRQMEEELYTHYGWSPYWRASTSPLESGAIAIAQVLAEHPTDQGEEESRSDPHLRSTREVIDYDVHAIDGDIGQIDDLIVDDEMWQIRYIVVGMEDKKVIVSPQWVENVNWTRKSVAVDLNKVSIQHAPEFDPTASVNREYEVRIYDYYGRPKYWTRL